MRTSPKATLAALAALLALALCGLDAPLAGARPSGVSARASSPFLTGIGDEHPAMFRSPLWQQLHTRIVRYIAPYDAATRTSTLNQAITFIQAAEVQHVQVLVAFYHSEYTPTKLPSVARYQRDVQRFVRLFPHVRQYQAWDEANRGNIRGVLASPSAAGTARYYQALIRVCPGCSVIGLDVLDAADIGPTLGYISEFKHEVARLRTVMPKIWGLHNYSDINRLQSWRTRALVSALGGQVWLTETGGLVQFGGAFPNRNGSGLSRAARVLRYMFAVARSQRNIRRLYIYDWTGGTARTRFDAGLMSARGQPRAGYIVVCRELHAAKCHVRVSRN